MIAKLTSSKVRAAMFGLVHEVMTCARGVVRSLKLSDEAA